MSAAGIPAAIAPVPSHRLDATLRRWDEISADGWSGLLIGNGASRCIWDAFAYASLLASAQNEVEHPLTHEDMALFTEMHTENFERVLAALKTASLVSRAMHLPTAAFDDRYASIQRALVEAVHAKHVPWVRLTDAIKQAMREALLPYECVYSTNYDLLVYWAVMHENGNGFKDYFWSEAFDLADTDVWGRATRVFYLHGGLHLYRTPVGNTLKRRAEPGQNLLDLFGTPMHDDAVPLFIAEGTSQDKLASIYRSDYLSFAYSKLVAHDGPLVVFGHGLGDSDQHIVTAIQKSGAKRIALSMLPATPREIIAAKGNAVRMFPLCDLTFFDARTHPLGDAALRLVP